MDDFPDIRGGGHVPVIATRVQNDNALLSKNVFPLFDVKVDTFSQGSAELN